MPAEKNQLCELFRKVDGFVVPLNERGQVAARYDEMATIEYGVHNRMGESSLSALFKGKSVPSGCVVWSASRRGIDDVPVELTDVPCTRDPVRRLIAVARKDVALDERLVSVLTRIEARLVRDDPIGDQLMTKHVSGSVSFELKVVLQLSILLLPADTTATEPRLALDRGIREVAECVAAVDAGKVRLHSETAVRVESLRSAVNKFRPQLVQFNGHGTQSGRLVLTDEHDKAVLLSGRALSELLVTDGRRLRCIVLSACYSAEIAAHLLDCADCVVGFSGPLADDRARMFDRTFYRAVCTGDSVGRACKLAERCTGTRVVTKCARGVNADEVFLVAL